MFKRAERLTQVQFGHYFKSGKRHNSPNLSVVYTKHQNLHVSVVVGKKIAKKAHDRNKIRRRIYGCLYILLKNKETGVFVVLAKPTLTTLTEKQQREEVQKIVSRITMSPTR